MNRKQDKRNLNTKQKIATSFLELAKYMPINKITINDIVKHCHINRNTFYYHFDNIYDLIKWVFNEETKPIIDNFNESNLEEFLNQIFDYIENHKPILTSAYNSFSREQLKDILHPYFYTIINTLIENHTIKYGINIDKDLKSFIIAFYSEGFAAAIINFYKDEAKIKRDKLIKYLVSLDKFLILAEKNIVL